MKKYWLNYKDWKTLKDWRDYKEGRIPCIPPQEENPTVRSLEIIIKEKEDFICINHQPNCYSGICPNCGK